MAIRRFITLGSIPDERAAIHHLMARYRQLMSKMNQGDRAAGKKIAGEADQIRREIMRRIERLPEGVLRDHLLRKLYE